MNHIRFLSTNKTVCQAPSQLGHDFVVVDYSEGESCQACLSLILQHNKIHEQYDLLVTLPDNPGMYPDKLAAARGCLLGVVLSSIFWLIVALIIYYAL